VKDCRPGCPARTRCRSSTWTSKNERVGISHVIGKKGSLIRKTGPRQGGKTEHEYSDARRQGGKGLGWARSGDAVHCRALAQREYVCIHKPGGRYRKEGELPGMYERVAFQDSGKQL